jgi:RNA polymerase sigma factor (sigma-70 family)
MAASAEEGEERSLYALLPSGEDAYERFEKRETLRAAMKGFSDMEKALLKYRFRDELSQSETAKRLGVTQMYVSRLERDLKQRLKESLKDSNI